GTQISDLLQAAFYLLAARAGGKGLGIGRKPSTNALYINMDTYFDLPVKSVIYMDNEMPIRSIIHRKKEDGGGWAYTPYIFQGDDGNPFAHIGAFGSADTHSYIFIGSNAYNGNNLRVNADGSIWTPAATVSSGGMSITGNIYIKPTSDAANSESFIQCYNNSSNDTITNYGCLGFMARSTVSGKPA
ncbi:MAG: hypothetical protein J6W64_03585, partial [Bacilli bacterium]|nr:hypothetical protein [Bacilli bacterium]